MITMENVCKSYKIAKRNAGFGEACKALFHREYEEIHALSNVSFTINDGEMVGYIGPNGAGKSSTIKILSGILTPENGQCFVDGRVPWKNRIEHVQEIGVVSLGQRMRCEVAASLLHSPRILFLDEPTIGLDAVSKLAVRDFIRAQNKMHSTTVILTTHDMQDIEALTKRIILIGKGQILMDGTLEDIKKGNSSIDETVAELYRTYEI